MGPCDDADCTHGALAWEDRESGETQDHRIADQVLHVSQAAGTDDKHGDDQADETRRGEIPSGIMRTQATSQSSGKTNLVQEAPEELETAE